MMRFLLHRDDSAVVAVMGQLPCCWAMPHMIATPQKNVIPYRNECLKRIVLKDKKAPDKMRWEHARTHKRYFRGK